MNLRLCKCVIVVTVLLLYYSCNEETVTISHRGIVRSGGANVELLDSVVLQMDSASMRGNFFMKDDTLCFADVFFGKVFQFDLSDGQMLSALFGKGKARDEISDFMFMYPVNNGDGSVFFIDSSNYFYTSADLFHIKRHGMIDFGWGENAQKDLASPSVYNIMEMTDFDFKVTQINDSVCIMPVSLINRKLGSLVSDRYKDGRIFGALNMKTMKVENVFCGFPEIYSHKPTNLFEFFSYDMSGDTIFVNHAVDSTIYVYKYPDKLLFTMGYECKQIDRGYSIGYDLDPSVLLEDVDHVGVSTQLYYAKDKGLLLRVLNGGKRYGNRFYLQIYNKDCDLVAEVDVPPFFKCVGHKGDILYGVNLIPIERNGEEKFCLYKLKIK